MRVTYTGAAIAIRKIPRFRKTGGARGQGLLVGVINGRHVHVHRAWHVRSRPLAKHDDRVADPNFGMPDRTVLAVNPMEFFGGKYFGEECQCF